MERITLILTFLCLIIIPSFSQSNCITAFGPIYGQPEVNERSKSILPTPANDGLYLVGMKADSTLIVKMDLNGQVIWSRSFDIIPEAIDNVTSSILDADGMICTVGIAGDYSNGGNAFAFRYDPNANVVMWAREYVTSTLRTYSFAIVQKPNGNYVIAFNPHTPLPGTTNDDEIFEINQSDGNIVAGLDFVFDWGGSDATSELVYYQNFIYGVGRYTDGDPNDKMRNTIIKFDPATLSQVWTKFGHVPKSGSARLYGKDLVIDQDQIYSIYSGDPVGASTSNTTLYFQKTDLDGNLVWLRRCDLPGNTDVAGQLIKSGNGFVILAVENAAPSKIILFKMDNSGNLVWAKHFQFPSFIASVTVDRGNSQLQEIAGSLYVTAVGINLNGKTDIILAKLDVEGNADAPCLTTVPATVTVSEVPNPSFYNITPEIEDGIQEVNVENPEFQLSHLPNRQECVVLDTVIAVVDTAICHGDQYEGYTEAGTYEDYFATSEGCDSLRILNLSVLDNIEFSIEKTICFGDEYEGYDHTGVFRDTFPTSGACDSIRTLTLRAIDCREVVWYNLNACESFMSNGSHMDYSEFTPEYLFPIPCGQVSATNVFRDPPQMNKHSCTPGVNNSIAMCISANASCTYLPGDANSLVFELNITPTADSVIQISGLDFFEKSPVTYSWISGPSGPNNYPKFYGIRVLKNGTEIFSKKDIPTGQAWSLQSYDFTGLEAFRIDEPALIRFELLPYCPVGNGALVSAWDIDEIRISAGCWPSHVTQPVISGVVTAMNGHVMSNVEISLSASTDFSLTQNVLTDTAGVYRFDNLNTGYAYYLKGSNTDAYLNGVNTFDLLKIQKHLLGIEPFTRPEQFIAADINRSASINVLDILDLRKALLGKITSFPGNTSWRFGSLDENNSWKEVQYTDPVSDAVSVHWKGIKIGDLNNDVVVNIEENQLQSRNEITFELAYADQDVMEGSNIEIHFNSETECNLNGFQFVLMAEDLELISATGHAIGLNPENYQWHEDGTIWFSWNSVNGHHLNKNDELITLNFMVKRNGRLSEMLQVLHLPLQPQAYLNNEVADLSLNVPDENIHETDAIGNIKIHPNPFNESVKMELEMKHAELVQFHFYNLSGQLIGMEEKQLAAGKQRIEFGSKEMGTGPGIITCQVKCRTQLITKKLVMVQ